MEHARCGSQRAPSLSMRIQGCASDCVGTGCAITDWGGVESDQKAEAIRSQPTLARGSLPVIPVLRPRSTSNVIREW